MIEKKTTKIRNSTFIVFVSQFVSLVLNIFTIGIAARYLGVENYGMFNYLLAIVGIGAKVLDFGFNPIIFREHSKHNNSKSFISSVILIRSLSIIIIVILFCFLAYILGLDELKIFLVALLAFNILLSNKFTNLRELVTIPFKVNFRMHIPMLIVILDNVLLLIFVILMPYFNGGLIYFTVVYLLANLPGMIILFLFMNKIYKFEFILDRKELSYLFRESYPLMGYIIIAFLYSQIDIILLQSLSGSLSVGVYSSALRLILPLKIIPNTIVISLFPIIVNNIKNEKSNQIIVNLIAKLFLLFSIIFISFIVITSNEIILIIFGIEYVDAAIPLTILSCTVFFDFFSFFVLDIFTAYGKQKFNFRFIFLITIFLFFSNLILIPVFGSSGAALSKFLVGFIGFAFLVFLLKSQIKIKFQTINKYISFLALLVAACTFFLGENFPIVTIFFVFTIFIMGLYLLKIFTRSEINLLTNFINIEWLNKFLTNPYK